MNRNNCDRRTPVILFSLLISMLCSACTVGMPSGQHQIQQDTFLAMDTVMTLTASGRSGREAIDDLRMQIQEMDRAFSRTREDSVISTINHSEGCSIKTDPSLSVILHTAKQYFYETDGLFDLTLAPVEDLWGFTADPFRIPDEDTLQRTMELVGMDHIHMEGDMVWVDDGTELDLGGIAKGFAVEKALKLYRAHGIEHGLANLGGDLLLLGTRPDGAPWNVAIQDPMEPDHMEKNIGILRICNAYVLTSGNYQRYFEENGVRYHHILNPFTGYPADSGLTSVTVVSDLSEGNGMMSDVLSTALFIMGAEGAMDFWRTRSDSFQMILVTDDHDVLVTEGLKDCFDPGKGIQYRFHIVS